MSSIVFALLGGLGSLAAQAKEDCAPIDATGAAAWFDQWNLSLASLNADQVVQRYWSDAVLLPTLSNTPRTTPAMVREYFTHFLEQHPRGRIDTRTVRLGCNLAIDMGTYTFALMDNQGRSSEVTGRYTFVYEYRGGAWKILHHHSSAMPEAAAKPAPGIVDAKPPKHGTPSAGPSASAAAHVATGETGARSKVSVIGGSQPFLNPDSSPNVSQFYPPQARARGDQGAVSMQVCTSPTGELQRAPEILESSGSLDLDSAAKEWANAADWIPATRQNTAVEGCVRVQVEFRLG